MELSYNLCIEDVSGEIIDDVGQDCLLERLTLDDDEPPQKRQRTSGDRNTLWVTVGKQSPGSVKLIDLANPERFFEVDKELIPSTNPFVEYQVSLDEFPPKSVEVVGMRLPFKITKERWNVYAKLSSGAVKFRKRDWNSKEKLQPTTVQGSKVFDILLKSPEYFDVVLAYGIEFADTLRNSYCKDFAQFDGTDKFYFPFMHSFVPTEIKFTRPKKLPDNLVKTWDAIEDVIGHYLSTGVFQFDDFSFLKKFGFLDDENKLVMARRTEKLIQENIELFTEVHINATTNNEDVPKMFPDGIIVPNAEHVSDQEWQRIISQKKPIICIGDPDFVVVDPFLKHHFNGFRYLCSLIPDPIVHMWGASWQKEVHTAFTKRMFMPILHSRGTFFRYVREVNDWQVIKKQIGITGISPPSNTLLLCGNDKIYNEAKQFMMPDIASGEKSKRIQTFDYHLLTKGDKLNAYSRLMNFTTLTSCFSDPRDDLVLIIDPDTPRSAIASVVKLAQKRVTVYWVPGTPTSKRIL